MYFWLPLPRIGIIEQMYAHKKGGGVSGWGNGLGWVGMATTTKMPLINLCVK